MSLHFVALVLLAAAPKNAPPDALDVAPPIARDQRPPNERVPAEDNHHPAIAELLDLVGNDAQKLQQRDLGTAERLRLALEIRAQGQRLPTLTRGQSPSARNLALQIDRQTGRLLDAVSRHDEAAIDREMAELSVQLTSLRAVLGP